MRPIVGGRKTITTQRRLFKARANGTALTSSVRLSDPSTTTMFILNNDRGN